MMIRIVVAWLVFTTMFSAAMGTMVGVAEAFRMRDNGYPEANWVDAFPAGFGMTFAFLIGITFFAALGIALIEWLDK